MKEKLPGANNPIIIVLMHRDGLSYKDARDQFKEALDTWNDGAYLDPEDFLEQEFGLEPDYVFDLINYI
jgi:hypothetical protein